MFAFALRIVASLSAPIDRGFVNPGFWCLCKIEETNDKREENLVDNFEKKTD